MKARSGIVMLALALVLLLFACTPAIASAKVTLNSYEKQVLKHVNAQRTKRGMAKLTVKRTLTKAARSHSADMGARQYFQHNTLGKATWSRRLIKFGYTRTGYSRWKVGENIRWGAGLYASPYAVVRAWMRSPRHRAVILTRSFRDIGIGARKCKKGYHGVDGPVWFFTIDLGRRIK